MQIKQIALFCLLIAQVATATAQPKGTGTAITAEQILQRAIDNAGGDAKLQAVQSAEFMSQLITADNDTLSVSVKRKGNNRYYVSILSFRYENTTTIFNNGKAVLIKNDTATSITEPVKLEEMALRCYSSIEFGYKKLGYKLNRTEDLHAGKFDCYGIVVESPLGIRTVNYYDKQTGACTMVMSDNGARTIYTSFLPYRGLVYTRDALIGDAQGKIARSYLREINIDEHPDDNWFILPPLGDRRPPAIFRTGHFRYVDGKDTLAIIDRKEKTQIESSQGTNVQHRIDWFSASDYVLSRLKNTSAPPSDDNIEYIKTRITLWSGHRYYCHYIASGDQAGTCAFEIVP